MAGQLSIGSAMRQKLHERTEEGMPLVTVRLIKGVFSPVQKQQMIRKLTEAMVSIEGENLRPVTWVVIDEVQSGEWGVGGEPRTPEQVNGWAVGGVGV